MSKPVKAWMVVDSEGLEAGYGIRFERPPRLSSQLIRGGFTVREVVIVDRQEWDLVISSLRSISKDSTLPDGDGVTVPVALWAEALLKEITND